MLSTENKLKFGIIGCSRIAERSVIPAISNSEFGELKMIGSRSMEKAQQFANKFKCAKFGTYEDVINDNDVDAVYISLPVGLHEEWTVKAAKSGKHVLCEKSSTTSYLSACRMIASCKENKVRFMEGFMFRFHPQHRKVIDIIKNGMIGKLFVFNGMYGFSTIPQSDIRYNPSLGGGVLNDAGCYPICASRIIFKEEPIGIISNLVIDEKTHVDIRGDLYLMYKDDKSAFVSFGYTNYYQANYKIWGSEGVIELQRAYAVPPNLSTDIFLHSNDFNKIQIPPTDHFLLMVNSFCKEILHIEKSEFDFEDDVLNQARIMEAARISSKDKKLVNVNDIV